MSKLFAKYQVKPNLKIEFIGRLYHAKSILL